MRHAQLKPCANFRALPEPLRWKLRALIAREGAVRTMKLLATSDTTLDKLVSGGAVRIEIVDRVAAAIEDGERGPMAKVEGS